MQIKTRKLNKNETYACSLKDIKQTFGDVEKLFVGFGVMRDFEFDTAFINRPQIKGVVISSLSINKRLDLPFETEPSLRFYVIRDIKYDEKSKVEFYNTILPMMKDWLHDTLAQQESGLPGVYEMLVEWTGAGFILHDCRFK